MGDMMRITTWGSDVAALLIAIDGLESQLRPHKKKKDGEAAPELPFAEVRDLKSMTKVLSGRLQEGQRTLRKRLTEFGLGVGGNVENTVASPRRKGKKKVKNDSVRAAEVASGSGTQAKTEQSEAVPVVPTQSQESSVPSGTLAASQQGAQAK